MAQEKKEPIFSPENFKNIAEEEKRLVMELGAKIGFKKLMYLAPRCWQEWNAKNGVPEGMHIVSGPLAVNTVRCGCKAGFKCTWCEGSLWVTKRVKTFKNRETNKNKEIMIRKRKRNKLLLD